MTKLCLECKTTRFHFVGIDKNTSVIDKCVETKIYNHIINCLVVDDILSSFIPSEQFNVFTWKISSNLNLADQHLHTCYIPGGVDMLLGSDVFGNL